MAWCPKDGKKIRRVILKELIENNNQQSNDEFINEINITRALSLGIKRSQHIVRNVWFCFKWLYAKIFSIRTL